MPTAVTVRSRARSVLPGALLLITGAAALSFVGGCGGGDGSTGVGETLDIEGIEYKVSKAKTSTEFVLAPGLPPLTSDSGLVVRIDMTVKNSQSKAVDAVTLKGNTLMFIDGDGKEYQSPSMASIPQESPVVRLGPGKSTSFWLVYLVPDGSTAGSELRIQVADSTGTIDLGL